MTDWFVEWTPEEARRQEDDRRDRWFQEIKINPSAEALARLCRSAREHGLRGMLHQGDLYWWQAFYATHNDALHWMKIAGSKRAGGVEMHVCDDGEIGLMAFDDATLAAAQAHPTLDGYFDADGSLITNPTLRLPLGD